MIAIIHATKPLTVIQAVRSSRERYEIPSKREKKKIVVLREAIQGLDSGELVYTWVLRYSEARDLLQCERIGLLLVVSGR